MKGCCWIPIERFFSYIMASIIYIWSDGDDVCFILDQHASLDLYSVSSLNQQSVGGHSTQKHYPDSEPTSLCSYSSIMSA